MKRALFVVALLTLTPSAVAFACSCMRSTPSEALERSTAVFEGRVLEVTPFEERGEVTLEGGCLGEDCEESLSETTHGTTHSGFAVRFSVTRRWKGVSTEEVVVRTARDSAGCGYAFEVGEDYVVYASAEEAGALSTGLCDRTARVADASEDLEALGTGEVPVDVDDESTPPATEEPPARGGCASCATGGASSPFAAGLPFAVALLLLRRRR